MNFILVVLLFFVHNINTTVLKSNDIRNFLGTRTPYRFKYNKNDSKLIYAHCKAQKIWMIVRHGTRLPSAKEINGSRTNLKDLKYEILLHNKNKKGVLSKEQLNDFERWSSDLSVDQEKFLTIEGQDEMVLLAERMQNRFPTVMKNKYENKTYQFRYTATQRAQKSAQYFTIGLFDKKDSQNVVFAPAAKVDTTLRFYKHCDKWQKQVKKNPNTYKEQILFGKSQQMNNTLESVSKNLGLNRVLNLDTVVLMYKICGYETSYKKYYSSPWCYGFTQESSKALEYYHDLKHYWLDGYGHELTYGPACMLFKHMLSTISNKGPKATFLFAHSGTLLKLLTYLQLYKPETHLTGDIMDDSRLWKTSNIDCFASNLAFVLYKCSDGDKILTLHQERIIKLPMCENELCPLEDLKIYFHDSINKCNYTDMCSLK